MIGTTYANIGTITALRGHALLNHDGTKTPIKVGSSIQEHDEIQTSKGSKLQIKFEDNTVISLGQNTHFKIDSYLNDTTNPKAHFSISKGFFKSITGKIGHIAPKHFKIKTANATIGVRGTTLIGQTDLKRDIIACTSGQIVVTNKQGSMVVNAGERTIVEQMKVPKQSQKVNPIILKQLDTKSDAKVQEAPINIDPKDASSKTKNKQDLKESKRSNDFEPWSEQDNSVQTLKDLELIIGEKHPTYEGHVTQGSTSHGDIVLDRSDVSLDFDLGTGVAQGNMHIEDTQANQHDIAVSGKVQGDGNFDLNSKQGYDGGAQGSLQGERLQHANGDFNFQEQEIGGEKNTISGSFETTHLK